MVDINHFEVLSLTPAFFLNEDELESTYNQCQVLFFDDQKKQDQINQSYKILKNDFLRIEHFLKINNFEFNDRIEEKKLLEFFELNMEIEELDETARYERLNEIKTEMTNLLLKIENLFYDKKIEDKKTEDKKIEELNDKFIEVKYLNRVLETYSI